MAASDGGGALGAAAAVTGLEADLDDGVLTVTVDRGDDRNLFTMDMARALSGLLEAPPDGAHVLRLRARGPVFCLGRERTADDTGDLRGEAEAIVGLNRALRTSRMVTLVEQHGDAAGFGAGLVANADVAIAAESARIWFPEVRIDLAPAVVLSWLPAIVGRKQAFWLTSTGTVLDAAHAAALGLVTTVVADRVLAEEVDAAVATLRGFTPRVHADIKAYLSATEDLSPTAAEGLAVERLIIGSLARRRDGEH
jgi:methylglutaconyl-CoA hydratase